MGVPFVDSNVNQAAMNCWRVKAYIDKLNFISSKQENSTMAEEEQKVISQQRNWADDEDDDADGDDVEIGGSTVAQVGQPKAAAA